MLAGIEDIHEDSSSVSCSSHVSTLHLTGVFTGYKVNMYVVCSGLHEDIVALSCCCNVINTNIEMCCYCVLR